MTDPSPLPFFVYGTLRPGEYNHALHLRGRVAAETPALLPDAVLHEGPGYPYLVEEPGAGPVHGELLTVRPELYAAVLADLDRLEDYRPGDPHNDYERVARDVRLPDGSAHRAWVYVAAPAVRTRLRARARIIPDGDWRSERRPGRADTKEAAAATEPATSTGPATSTAPATTTGPATPPPSRPSAPGVPRTP